MNTIRTWNDLLNLFSKGRYRVRANGQNHIVDFTARTVSIDTPGVPLAFKSLNYQELQTKLETLQIIPLTLTQNPPERPHNASQSRREKLAWGG